MTPLLRAPGVALLALVLGCASAPRPHPPPASEQVPVLFVHGTSQTARFYSAMVDSFADAGWARERMYAVSLHPADGQLPLEVMAYEVLSAAEVLRRHTGAERIDVVAYSQGALSARYWMQELGGQRHVRRFVSISGPHHGTRAAYLLGDPAIVQMRPGSDFLRALNRHEGEWGETEVFSFWTPTDITVSPPDSSRLAGATNRTFFVPVHQLMLDCPALTTAIQEVLAQPPRVGPARPPALQETR